MRHWTIGCAVLLIASICGQASAEATERLLKMRTYNFACGTNQECSGWRHSFAYLDPAAKNAELPRETFVDIYTSHEVDDRLADVKTEVSRLVDEAISRAGGPMSSAPDDRNLREEIAADVVARLGRIMAEREAQMREWLRQEIRDELKAAGKSR